MIDASIMTDRERLVETMARTIVPQLWDQMSDSGREFLRHNARLELETIEAAGWTLVPPGDGR